MASDDYVNVECRNCDKNGMCHTANPRKGILMDRPYKCPRCNGTKVRRVHKDDIPTQRN